MKQRLTLATVLNYYSLNPDKNLRLNCPFHEDKTPSLQVYYKTHTAYCFSSNCKTPASARILSSKKQKLKLQKTRIL
ncbi:CHC2 zinc finger domain-containing protein [Flavobacterium sp.]|uniref:CHC2 zinc finger domain-containing protein n=1 Tax=Flavobacterium sp. TaxID=239 RepID=UPI0039198535